MNLKALCKEADLELYDSELVSENGKTIYRIYVVKPLESSGERQKVNLDDCARLSEILSPIFDVEPPVKGEYFLEVSSAGLERKLTKLEHFALSVGELVKITATEKITAKILSIQNENIHLETLQGEKITINFNEIKKAKTFIEW